MLLLKRSVAFLIDLLLVCVFGLVLYPVHTLLEEHLWLYYVVFYLANCLYHGEFESVKGATPGQSLFGLRVESESGSKLDFKTAFARAALFHFPLLLSVIPESPGGLLGSLVAGAVLFFWLAVPVFILGHPEHRGLHEILTRTHVAPGTVVAKPWATRALASLAVLLVFVIAIDVWTEKTVAESGAFDQMMIIRDHLRSDARVMDAGARLNTFQLNQGKPVRTFAVVMQVPPRIFEDPQQRGELSEKAYALLRENAPTAQPLDYYGVEFIETRFFGLIRMTYQQFDRRAAGEPTP